MMFGVPLRNEVPLLPGATILEIRDKPYRSYSQGRLTMLLRSPNLRNGPIPLQEKSLYPKTLAYLSNQEPLDLPISSR